MFYQPALNPDANPYTVPLGIGFLASVLKRDVPNCNVRLFRDPDQLMRAVRKSPPHLLGFSICSWNTDLSRRVSELIKCQYPGTITVRGGPSVDDADDQIIEFFAMFPSLDYLVPNEGESGLLAAVRSIIRGQERAEPIPGVAYLDKKGRLVRGRYERPIVSGSAAGLERISPKQERPVRAEQVEILT